MSELQVVETFSTSDHCNVEFSLILGHDENCTSPPAAVYYDYERADYDSIVLHLLNDSFLSSPRYDQGETADQVWDKFIKPLNEGVQLYVPVKSVHASSAKKPKWRPHHILCAVSKKRHLWRLYRKSRSLADKSRYQEQCVCVKKLVYDYDKQVEQSVINSANLGRFYGYVNGKLSCKSGVGPLKSGSNKIIVSDVEKAELLNNYFWQCVYHR